MNLDNYIPKGDIEGFPKEVIAKMLEEQVKQGNKEDVTVFEVDKKANKSNGGFDWYETNLNIKWSDAITNKNFDAFFEIYPKEQQVEAKSTYPKVMMVWDNSSSRKKEKRVVVMEKMGKFIAWVNAETLEEAEDKTVLQTWDNAKDLESEHPLQPKSIEDRLAAIEKHLNIK